MKAAHSFECDALNFLRLYPLESKPSSVVDSSQHEDVVSLSALGWLPAIWSSQTSIWFWSFVHCAVCHPACISGRCICASWGSGRSCLRIDIDGVDSARCRLAVPLAPHCPVGLDCFGDPPLKPQKVRLDGRTIHSTAFRCGGLVLARHLRRHGVLLSGSFSC
jgi:hypothetical protein